MWPIFWAVLSLGVDPTFLAHVANVIWHGTDAEICKFACHARWPYVLFLLNQFYGYDLVFQGYGE